MFSLESHHRGDSNEYKQYTIFNLNKKNTLNYPKSASIGFFSKGLKNEFKAAVVNEPSVFEPLKFYCIYILTHSINSGKNNEIYPSKEKYRIKPICKMPLLMSDSEQIFIEYIQPMFLGTNNH